MSSATSSDSETSLYLKPSPFTRLIPSQSISQTTFPLWQRVIIFSVAVANISAQYLYFSVPLPFLANEIIEKRDMTPMVAGVVFGALCLSLFLTLLSAPKTASLLSIRHAIITSISLSVLSTVFYLHRLDNNYSWTAYTIVSRIFQGIAIGITDVRYLDMMSQCFPDKLALVTSAYEIGFSVCLMVAPVLGGYLYETLGFWAPLNISTIVTVTFSMVGYLTTYWLPSLNNGEVPTTARIKDVLYWPILVICFLVMCTLSIADTIVQSFFANYMFKVYNLQSDSSGYVMTVAGVCYSVATFVSGILGSNKKNLKYLLISGLGIMGVSCCLLGNHIRPLGYYLPGAMFCIVQIGSGLAQVAALPLMVGHYKKQTSLTENTASCHMGGVYGSFYFLGSFLGPSIGGVVIQLSSFDKTCVGCGILLLISMSIIMGIWFFNPKTFLNPWREEGVMQEICNQ